MCSEYHVLRLAGAEANYKIVVESEGSLPGANTITEKVVTQIFPTVENPENFPF